MIVYVFCEKKFIMVLFSYFYIIFDRLNIGFVIFRMVYLKEKYVSFYVYIINLMCIYIWFFYVNMFLKNVF